MVVKIMVPFWVPYIRPRIRPRIIIGTQKGTIILTVPHVKSLHLLVVSVPGVRMSASISEETPM